MDQMRFECLLIFFFSFYRSIEIFNLEYYGLGVIRMLANFYRGIETFILDTIICESWL